MFPSFIQVFFVVPLAFQFHYSISIIHYFISLYIYFKNDLLYPLDYKDFSGEIKLETCHCDVSCVISSFQVTN